MLNDAMLKRALTFDALDAAERITGKSYKEDEATGLIGLAAQMRNGDLKRKMLEEVGDSTFSCKLDRYLTIIGQEGFEPALELPFFSDSSGQNEKYHVHFKPSEGILLAFDTYCGGTSVNSGKFHYNWRTPTYDYPRGITSSGCWTDTTGSGRWDPGWVWAGDHDCREAIRFHIRQLREAGSFVTPWAVSPRPWLTHHGDRKERVSMSDPIAAYDRIAAERIAMLPASVRAAIQVNK